MPTALLQLGCTIRCPHGGVASVTARNNRVRLGGSFALLATDGFAITGCPHTMGVSWHPCATIEWSNAATRVRVLNEPVLLESSLGHCKAADGLVQGTAQISGVQTRVRGE